MKMRLQFCILFLSMLTTSLLSYSNTIEQDSIISISGQIIHPDSLRPIPLATVSIKRTRKGVICDSLGVFHLQVQQYDTLRISALGYKKIEWAIPLIINPDFPPFFQIKLEDISYLIDEVTVSSWRNWNEFKEEFIRSKAPKEDNLAINFKLSEVDMRNIKDEIAVNSNPTFDFLGAFIYYGEKLFCKNKKPSITYSDEVNEQHRQMLNAKYNKQLIADLTHEKNTKLDQLTTYINSQTNFTFESNEVNIQKKILELYEEFKLNPEIINEQKFAIDSSKQLNNHLRP